VPEEPEQEEPKQPEDLFEFVEADDDNDDDDHYGYYGGGGWVDTDTEEELMELLEELHMYWEELQGTEFWLFPRCKKGGTCA
jgi:NDP-sugar pyrophosphorylase family protein